MGSISLGRCVSRRQLACLLVLFAGLVTQTGRVTAQAGLVAAWSFNEGAGSTVDDRSTNANLATLDGAGWAPGQFGAGVSFDGIDDLASVADSDELDLASAFTLQAWVYPDVSTAPRTILAKENTSSLAYALSLTADNKARVDIVAGGVSIQVTGTSVLVDDTWTHLAATYNGTELRIWVNGTLEASTAASGTLAVTDLPLHIGGDLVTGRSFAGKLDEIRLYNVALSGAEIQDDMQASIDDLTPPSIASAWPPSGSINVHPSASITVAFTESLDPATVGLSTFELRDASTALVGATVAYDDPSRTVTVDPLGTLTDVATYTIHVRGGGTAPVVKDVSGNALASPVSWSFTTADATPPAVTAITPLPSQRNVPLNSAIAVTFSEPVNGTTVTTTTFTVKDTRNATVAGAISYDLATNTATFTPESSLLPTRTYSVSLAGGSAGTRIEDLAGNALASTYTATFLTTVEPNRIAAGNVHSVAVDDGGQVWTWGSDTYGQRGTDLDGRVPGAVAAASSIRSVAATRLHTLALKTDGSVLAWGMNWYGQIGNGNTTSQQLPVAVSGLTDVIAIEAGHDHSVALKADGTVWTWGAGPQIGDGMNTQRLTPVQVTGLTDVIAIAAGGAHTMALKADGTVWAWGVNTSGQLGDGTYTSPRLTPVQVSGLTGVVAIAAGDWHSVAIAGSDLSLRVWGSNGAGQLGDGTGLSRNTPVLVTGLATVRAVDGGANRTVAALLDGSIRIWGAAVGETGSTSTVPIDAPGSPTGYQVAAGATHQLAVTRNGVVAAWTDNGSGQIGDGTTVQRRHAVRISEPAYAWKVGTPILGYATGTYTSPLTVSVTSATPGATLRYTLDESEPTELSTDVPVGGVAVNATATLKTRAWKSGQPASNIETTTYTLEVAPPSFSPTAGTYTSAQQVSINAPAGATIRYTVDGTEPSEVSAAYVAPVSVNTTTTLKARGYRAGWTTSTVATAVYTLQVPALVFTPDGGSSGAATTVTMTNTAPDVSIRYTTDGSEPRATSPVYTSPIAVPATTTVRAVGFKGGWLPSPTKIASYRIVNGTASAPLFDPAPGAYVAETLVRISAPGSDAVIRFTTDGTEPTSRSPRYRWPLLLTSTTTLRAKAFRPDYNPSATTSGAYALDASGAVATPTLSPGGGEFKVAQTVTVSVATAGATIHYTINGTDPTEADPVVASGDTILVDRSLPLKVRAFKAGLNSSAVHRGDYMLTGAIAVGKRSSYALKADGSLWVWGYNNFGQLGDGTTTTRLAPIPVPGLTDVVGISTGGDHTLAVTRTGHVWAWGYNGSGQLGLGHKTTHHTPTQIPTLSNVVAVAAGERHSLALRADGSVWAWGENWYGELGTGTTTATLTPVQVPGLTGVSAIAAGTAFSLALQDDGAGGGLVWGWGLNDDGQLGDGTISNRLSPVRVALPIAAAAVAATLDTAYAIGVDGSLWGWGDNSNGEVGDGTEFNERWVPVRLQWIGEAAVVAGGGQNGVAVTSEGFAWSWGADTSSNLGDGLSIGRRQYPDRMRSLTGVLGVAFGEANGVVVLVDGTVWGWGSNASGSVGDGTTTLRSLPVPASNLFLTDNTWLIADPDGDGLATWTEIRLGIDPFRADSNGNGLSDGVDQALSIAAGNPDMDNDHLSNIAEAALGTDAFAADSDGDGVTDGADAFPLDSTRFEPLAPAPGDITPPTITLTQPTNAVPLP